MSHSPKRAFTLIELLVVILIIAVISAVIVPAYAGFYDKARFDAEVRRIEDYFAEGRELAVKNDVNVTVHFEHSIGEFTTMVDPLPPQNDLPTNMLTAPGTDLAANPSAPPYRVGSDYRVENFAATAGGSAAGGSAAGSQSDVHFHGDGTSDSATLSVVSRQGYTASLRLTPSTGRISLDTQGAGR